MSNEFSLVGLVPRPIIFRDADGVPHPMKARRALDLADLVTCGELLRTAQAAQARLGMERVDPDSPQSVTALRQGAAEVDQTLNALLALLVPTVARDAWAAVGFQDKWALVEFWESRQPTAPPGEPPAVGAAGAPTPPSRPSPDSSPPTGLA